MAKMLQKEYLYKVIILLYILVFIFTVTPFLPATENPHWFFRTADFVRLQSMAIQLIIGVLLFFFSSGNSYLHWSIALFLFLSFLYQLQKVYSYSSLYPRQKPTFESDGAISIFAANVLQTNTNYKGFLNEVNRFDADLVLLMESDREWEKGVSTLEEKYPYTVKMPLDNFYGMHLYSKKELEDVETLFQIEEDVPSIYFKTKIGTQEIQFVCLHPAPPSPTENETSNERDAELILSAKKIRKSEVPVVICGDMNDVVWSRVSRLLKKMTGMIDPRVGRGFFPTYHAGYWFMRFPLDHLFHTPDLFVNTMKRSQYFGSDHFGMYYDIHIKKEGNTKPPPKLSNGEKQKVKETIEKVDSEN